VKGFYSPVDKLAAELPRTKGTGAEFMTELSKRPGYKPQEAQDRDLQTLMALPKMAREEFLAKLKAKPAPQLEDTVLDNASAPTKFDQWTLPGGTNYREILMRMPHDEQRAKEFSDPASGHWDQPDVLAHVRAKDRTGPNGEKLLHIEEIQSDWHQKGREHGYATPESLQEFRAAELRHRLLKRQLDEAKAQSESAENSLKRKEPLFQQPDVRERYEAARVKANNDLMDLMPQVMKAQAEVQDFGHKMNSMVPDAPFKKNWHEMALKKMIHHAAENGYHGIVITPGEEQAKRYDLSKRVSRVTHMTHRDDPESGILFAFDPAGRQIVEKHNVPHSELPDYIGKEGAQKLLEQKPDETGYRELSGQNLQVGGEGMRGFYDKMVPSFLNQFGKKYGAQVSQMQVPVIFNSVNLHHFPITPEMRKDVTKNGVPLYAKGGDVHMAGGSIEDLQDTVRKNDAYQDIEKYLQTKDAMPDVEMTSNLPEGTNGMFTSLNLPIGKGQLKLNKNTPKQVLPSVLTHELAHATDRQMMQQAMEQGMFGKSNQFTEAYEKLVGPEGRNCTDLARKLNPYWATDNQYYRALPQEIAAHGIGAFSGPSLQDPAPKHVDATAATEFRILLDLAQRNADKGPQGLAKIPAFFNKIGRYAKGGEVEVRPTVKDETIQRKIPEMESAVKALQAGEIKHKDYDKVVSKHKPVKPYTFVPQPASDEDAERALMVNKKPQWRGHLKWPSGRKVGLRLDIPAYENHGVWVNSIHDEEGNGEDKLPTAYNSFSSVKNATFDAKPEKAVRVATGEQNKSPFARILGDLHHMTEDEAVEHMKKYLNHPDYVQVGMDPRRHGFFYDRKTMKPVTHSAHVVQIGPLVLAHKPKYGKRETYAVGGDVKPRHERDANLAQFLKDSAVKNRMYHGTNKDIKSFKAPKNAVGIWATKNPDVANEYATISARGVGEPPSVYPVHVRLKNPANKDQFGDAWDLAAKDSSRLGWNTHDERHKKILQDQGFDGAILDDSVVVFDPKHIKSAIGNRGTYDVNDPDITKAKGGSIKPVGYTKEKVTVSPSLDQMQYELISVKHSKKVK
jgi:hypothetical protein